MKRRRWPLSLLVVALVSALYAGPVLAQDRSGDPWYPQPEPAAGDLTDSAFRTQLLGHKQDLCQDLEVASSVILNTGALNGFRPMIQDVSGLSIGELETELQTCTPEGFAANEGMTSAELVADVRMVEWLLKIHLVSLDQATIAGPQAVQAPADNAIGDFLKLHDVVIAEMRSNLAALTDDSATLEEAKALAAFWQDVLIPHAEAEHQALFPLLREKGNEQLAQSADVIEAEHGPIEEGIAQYMMVLRAAENGQGKVEDLIPIARQIRGSVELHFGREEATLIDPLAEIMSPEEFAPVVAAQDEAIGTWLREQGWQPAPSE